MVYYRIGLVFVFAWVFVGLIALPLKLGTKPLPILAFSVCFALFYYIFVGRFYKVEIDDSALYFQDLIKKGEVSLTRLISVKDEWIPVTVFFRSAYGITVRYKNEHGKIRKIKFLSPETHWGGHPFQIAELKFLKSKIVRQKPQF